MNVALTDRQRQRREALVEWFHSTLGKFGKLRPDVILPDQETLDYWLWQLEQDRFTWSNATRAELWLLRGNWRTRGRNAMLVYADFWPEEDQWRVSPELIVQTPDERDKQRVKWINEGRTLAREEMAEEIAKYEKMLAEMRERMGEKSAVQKILADIQVDRERDQQERFLRDTILRLQSELTEAMYERSQGGWVDTNAVWFARLIRYWFAKPKQFQIDRKRYIANPALGIRAPGEDEIPPMPSPDTVRGK